MRTRKLVTFLFIAMITIVSLYASFHLRERSTLHDGEDEGGEGAASWAGMDEAVVERYATMSGREASGPLLPVEEGDLPLFLFCLAGLAGGFLAGYFWRMLITEGIPSSRSGTRGT